MPKPRKLASQLAPSTIAKGGAAYKNRMTEPQYKPFVLSADNVPDDLLKDEIASRVWRDVADFLNESRVMTIADVNQLIIYCQTYADWRRDEETIALEGRTVRTDRGGMQKHPLIAVVNANKLLLNNLGQQFGMTPASRSKVNPAPEPKKGNSFADD